MILERGNGCIKVCQMGAERIPLMQKLWPFSDLARDLREQNVRLWGLVYCLLKTKLRGPSPRAKYTDRETAACWRS
jgi:hypothetical protein